MLRRSPAPLPTLAVLMLAVAVTGAHCHANEPAAVATPAPADSGGGGAPPNEGLTEAEAGKLLPGIDTAGLTPKQRSDLVDLAGDTFCPCAATTVAACLRDGPSCPAAKRLIDLSKKLIAAGQPQAQVLLRVETYYGNFAEDRRANVPAIGPSQGPENAPIQIVEFSDFQCPACRAAHPALTDLLKKYPKDVRWVFRNFPLPQHEHAEQAAEAGIYAASKGKFWQAADWFFGHQEKLGDDAIKECAKAIGVDPTAMFAATKDDANKAKVEADKTAGNELKLQGTPSIFINGRAFVLAPTLEYLSWSVEDEMQWLAGGKKWSGK